jgi:hypothetical protein
MGVESGYAAVDGTEVYWESRGSGGTGRKTVGFAYRDSNAGPCRQRPGCAQDAVYGERAEWLA